MPQQQDQFVWKHVFTQRYVLLGMCVKILAEGGEGTELNDLLLRQHNNPNGQKNPFSWEVNHLPTHSTACKTEKVEWVVFPPQQAWGRRSSMILFFSCFCISDVNSATDKNERKTEGEERQLWNKVSRYLTKHVARRLPNSSASHCPWTFLIYSYFTFCE